MKKTAGMLNEHSVKTQN